MPVSVCGYVSLIVSLVSVKRFYVLSVCVFVCGFSPATGSKGQLKSQHIVSPETQQKILKKEPAEP